MSKRNILIKKKNSKGWDELFPITTANNVKCSNGKSVESQMADMETKRTWELIADSNDFEGWRIIFKNISKEYRYLKIIGQGLDYSNAENTGFYLMPLSELVDNEVKSSKYNIDYALFSNVNNRLYRTIIRDKEELTIHMDDIIPLNYDLDPVPSKTSSEMFFQFLITNVDNKPKHIIGELYTFDGMPTSKFYPLYIKIHGIIKDIKKITYLRLNYNFKGAITLWGCK